MIGLDTNVLVRYFTQDDAKQFKAAVRLIDTELSPQSTGFISCLVLVELFWVLQRLFQLPVEAMTNVLETLLAAPQLVVENRTMVRHALSAFASGQGDFADALIGLHHQAQGCAKSVTFDKKASGLAGMALLT